MCGWLATATAACLVCWQQRPVMTPQYGTIPQESRHPLDGKLIIMDIIQPEGNSDLCLSELKATQDIDFPSLPAIPLPAPPSENLQNAESIIMVSYISLPKLKGFILCQSMSDNGWTKMGFSTFILYALLTQGQPVKCNDGVNCSKLS